MAGLAFCQPWIFVSIFFVLQTDNLFGISSVNIHSAVTKHIIMRMNLEKANAQTQELQIVSAKSQYKIATHLFFPFS
ncbi:hypothetical protein SAMN05444274_101249 [Mariniphaga anaerophila]|uniref:Uncharacterized protein n=1 Tax=Mariniphaga anaerophila TaxID=1484053 RepID=A0A1M4T414_9BACT|nr:hypothetical protein SAMN05444274_101249 [Mariniphaga anaerophila]